MDKLILQSGKIGDVINLLPLCYAAQKANMKVGIMACAEFADVLDGCSYVEKVVFSGEQWKLQEAYDEAKKICPNVVVTQVNGPKDLVQELTYKPHGQKGCVKESFDREAYFLANALEAWGKFPLVFDRRSPEREAALLPPKPKGRWPAKPIILIALESKSSPFPYKHLLLKLLESDFGKTHNIIDLCTIKAERFYDLLGLYEKAECLVTVDTAHLHLAAAVPSLPVMALIQDGPTYWHGTAWRPNHNIHCRYRDFPMRALEFIGEIAGTNPQRITVNGIYHGGYNPSIIRHKGMLLMAYRYHPDTSAATKLAIAELDENFNVVNNQALDIHDESSSHEDCRLFEFKGELWMSFVASHWPSFPGCTVKYLRLAKPDHWRCETPQDYERADREAMEKNHLAFPVGDKLHIIYRSNPKQVIYTAGESGEMVSDGLRWPYGEVRGGSVPLPYKGKLLRFFHSRLENESPGVRWRYYIGAMLMEPEPPFKMVAISDRPIMVGSDAGGDINRRHYKRNVVFPGGAIEYDGGFALSIGNNDSSCVLVIIKPCHLHF